MDYEHNNSEIKQIILKKNNYYNDDMMIENEKKEIDKNVLYETEFRDLVDYLYDNIVLKYKEMYPEILHNYNYSDFSVFLEKKMSNLIKTN